MKTNAENHGESKRYSAGIFDARYNYHKQAVSAFAGKGNESSSKSLDSTSNWRNVVHMCEATPLHVTIKSVMYDVISEM